MSNLVRFSCLSLFLLVYFGECSLLGIRPSRPAEDIKTVVENALLEFAADDARFASKYAEFLTKENIKCIRALIPREMDKDLREEKILQYRWKIVNYLGEVVNVWFKDLLNRLVASLAELNGDPHILSMWSNARNRLTRSPYRSRVIQARIFFYEKKEIHAYAVDLWLEEMEYRLIKSELDVFHAYESWIGNQYEYLEILYNSWRSADRPNSKRQEKDTWRFVQNVYADIHNQFRVVFSSFGLRLNMINLNVDDFSTLQKLRCLKSAPRKGAVLPQRAFDDQVMRISREISGESPYVEPEDRRNFDRRNFGPLQLLKNRFIEKRSKEPLHVCGTGVFDSYAHSMAHIYIETSAKQRAKLNQAIQRSPDVEFFRFVVLLAEKGATEGIHLWRNEILTLIHETTSQNGVSYMYCSSAIRRFLDAHICSKYPAMLKTFECHCSTNSDTGDVFNTLPIDQGLLQQYGIPRLQQVILASGHGDFRDEYEICGVCRSRLTKSYHFNDIVFIYITFEGNQQSIRRQSIPRFIDLKDDRYTLKSSIDYISEKKRVVASCFRSDGRWYLYDDKEEEAFEAPRRNIPKVLIYEKMEWT